jgi:cytochrome c peroxidase
MPDWQRIAAGEVLMPYWTAVLSSGLAFACLTWHPGVSAFAGQNPPATDAPPVRVPSPSDNPTTQEKVALGKLLFFDPRLSGDNRMNRATCHIPEKAFTDGLKTAKGAAGKSLKRNTQSLLNVGLYAVYFWDGRAGSLEDQVLTPISSADEMSQDVDELVHELGAVPGYVKQFQSAFGTGITKEGVAQALAAFERTLITRNSPFDRFLAGDKSALSEEAREGWRLFREAGCIRCHNGPALSDNKFYRLGVDYRDPGRGAITGDKQHLYAFRTPGLRDVARTAPYMHDGSFETLEQVVQFYYRSTPAASPNVLTLDFEPLIGRSFSEIAPILAFLDALTGEAPEISPPRLP